MYHQGYTRLRPHILVCLLLTGACAATRGPIEDGAAQGGASADDISRELANPTNALGKLSFNLDYTQFEGDLVDADDQSSTLLTFQPALPVPLEGGKNFFARPAIPILIDQPVFVGDGFDNEGVELGDIGFDLGYGGPVGDAGVIMLAGLVGTLPTGTEDSLTSDQWSIGPEFLVGKLFDWGAIGILLTHQWDVADTSSDAADVNVTGGQYFYTYLLSDGWAVGAGPSFSYDWEADSDDRLTLPIGTGVNRTAVLGSIPVKFALEAYYFVEQPDAFGPEWSVRFSITPIVPLPW